MCEEENRQPERHDEDQAEVEEVTTEFDDSIRVRSAFTIDEIEPGVLGINIFGPIFEFDDEEEHDLDDEGEQE